MFFTSLIIEIFVKSILQYHGAIVFRKAVNKPRKLANTVLTFILICLSSGPKFLCRILPKSWMQCSNLVASLSCAVPHFALFWCSLVKYMTLILSVIMEWYYLTNMFPERKIFIVTYRFYLNYIILTIYYKV